VGEEGVLY
jgi:hypothetical protein